MNKLLLVSVLSVGTFLFSGCQSSAKKTTPVLTPVPVTTGTVGPQAPAPGNQPQAPASASSQTNQRPQVSPATMRASTNFAQQTGGRMIYSSAQNLIDPWQNPVTDAIVWVKNVRKENIFLQLGDRAVGIPDGNGNLMLVVLPPGETYGIPDYKQRPPGYAAKTQIDANILDDENNILGYLWTSANWPVRGQFWGKEMRWDLFEGDPVTSTERSTPIKVPSDPNRNSGSIRLTSGHVQAIQNALQGPAQTNPNGSTAPAPSGGNQPAPTRTP